MSFLSEFENRLPPELKEKYLSLESPFDIQSYLDSLPYIAENRDRSPLNVLLDGQCHCLDGGLFAALALWKNGYKPLLIDLVPEPGADDDHVLALYQVDGYWGAVAKSNYVNLGFREAVHSSLRQLVMTYFEHYFNVSREKTLRGYTRALDVSKYTYLNWAWDEIGANKLYYKIFYKRKPILLFEPTMIEKFSLITERGYSAETIHTDLTWAFGNRSDE